MSYTCDEYKLEAVKPILITSYAKPRGGRCKWEWRDNPESREICPELSQLVELPEPSPDAKTVLECLADRKGPFFKPEPKHNELCISFGAFLMRGELADRKPEIIGDYIDPHRNYSPSLHILFSIFSRPILQLALPI